MDHGTGSGRARHKTNTVLFRMVQLRGCAGDGFEFEKFGTEV